MRTIAIMLAVSLAGCAAMDEVATIAECDVAIRTAAAASGLRFDGPCWAIEAHAQAIVQGGAGE